jgi:hypothetical protein
MKSIAFVIALMGSLANAQQFSPPANCQMQINPHSYACTRWTFDGNQVFPLLPIDFAGALQGSWRAITFADPTGDNVGPEFMMQTNAQRPTIPEGVVDRATNQFLGDLFIGGNRVVQTNWRGQQLETVPGSLMAMDVWTLRFSFNESRLTHTFTCRDFNRNGTHHLLCAWDLWSPKIGRWTHKGFIGYLRVN